MGGTESGGDARGPEESGPPGSPPVGGGAEDAGATEAGERAPRRSRRGRWIAAVVAVAALAAAGAAVAPAMGLVGGPAESGASDALPPATAEVTRQTLSDTRSAPGELGYGPVSEAAARAAGTLTRVPESGAEVGRGETLFEVDTEPVTVMYGDHPAYRTMTVGSEGDDVRQLEDELGELGYGGFTADGTYTGATAAAVLEWQDDRGMEQTGAVEQGDVVFTSGAVRVDAFQAAEGDQVQKGGPVLEYTGTRRLVTAELEPADRRLAEEGGDVEVTLPGGAAVAGKVDDVTTVVVPGSGEEEDETVVEVVIALDGDEAKEKAADHPLASVDAAFVSETREDVLTAPVAALLALNEGGFGVEVVENSTSSYVPVETGLFADGRVEVSGDGITEGSVVGVPE